MTTNFSADCLEMVDDAIGYRYAALTSDIAGSPSEPVSRHGYHHQAGLIYEK
jgi:hypothetical protein